MTWLLAVTYVNIFRRMVNGRGTIRSMKSAISATKSRKTYRKSIVSIAFLRVRLVLKPSLNPLFHCEWADEWTGGRTKV